MIQVRAAGECLAGNFTADERLAAFPRLASESVSRGFRRLQDTGLVPVDRREIELRDLPKLEAMASSILRS